jgi:hypothetical protein
LLASLPVIARAQAKPGSFEAGGTVAFSTLSSDFGTASHLAYGGTAAYNFNERIAAGAEFTYSSLGSFNDGGVNVTGHLTNFAVNSRYSFPDHVFKGYVPYVMVGFGSADETITASVPGYSVTGKGSVGYFTFGGGANLYSSSNWVFRPEVRYEDHGGLNDLQIAISALYEFGGKTSPTKKK